VPVFLRNAALKRAWAADPGIRDYVNPAMEYAFDWNVIGGVPGSGELEAGYDAASQVAQMFSTPLKIKGEEAEEGAHTLVAEVSTEALAPAEDALALSPPPRQEPAVLAVRLSIDEPPVENEQKQISAESDADASGKTTATSPQPLAGAPWRGGSRLKLCGGAVLPHRETLCRYCGAEKSMAEISTANVPYYGIKKRSETLSAWMLRGDDEGRRA
jgi:hypothetical protein